MNEYEKLRVKAKQIKEGYPKGTRLELNSMSSDEPDPIPPFTRGTVVAVDDIGTILMQWDNGRTLSLIPGEDTFRKLSDKECFEEKNQKNFERFSAAVDRDIFPAIETEKLSGENKRAYIKEIMEKLHALFVSVYGTDTVTPDYGYLEVPGIVRASGGEYFPALLGIDFGASGEHWKTCFITPHGIFEQDDEEPTTGQEQFLQSVIPYRYWYTIDFHDDIHIDWNLCPDEIWEIISECKGKTLEQTGGMIL